MPCFSNVGAILKCVDFETIQAVPLARLIILLYCGYKGSRKWNGGREKVILVDTLYIVGLVRKSQGLKDA